MFRGAFADEERFSPLLERAEVGCKCITGRAGLRDGLGRGRGLEGSREFWNGSKGGGGFDAAVGSGLKARGIANKEGFSLLEKSEFWDDPKAGTGLEGRIKPKESKVLGGFEVNLCDGCLGIEFRNSSGGEAGLEEPANENVVDIEFKKGSKASITFIRTFL
jgi:hypothetical protein